MRTRWQGVKNPKNFADVINGSPLSVCQMCSGVGSIMWRPREREGLSAVCFIAVLLKRTIHLWRGFSKALTGGNRAGEPRNRGGGALSKKPLSRSNAHLSQITSHIPEIGAAGTFITSSSSSSSASHCTFICSRCHQAQ